MVPIGSHDISQTSGQNGAKFNMHPRHDLLHTSRAFLAQVVQVVREVVQVVEAAELENGKTEN